jgi:hypothetical protein
LVAGSLSEVVKSLVEHVLQPPDGTTLISDFFLSILPKSPPDVLVDKRGSRTIATVCLSIEIVESLLSHVGFDDLGTTRLARRRLIHVQVNLLL